jgi:hypothetical protein
MLTPSATNAAPPQGSSTMPDTARLADLNAEIALTRENLRQVTEQAAARSGAADDALDTDRIATLDAKLKALIKERDALEKS